MGTPAAVKKMSTEADKIHAKIYSPEAEKDAKPDGEDETAPDNNGGEGQAAQAQEPTPAPEAKETPEPAPTPEVDWQQRYKTLQGKYNAEIPRLQSQVRDMQDVMAQMQAAQSAPASAPVAEPEEKAGLVSQQEIEDYGADFIDVMKRVAQQQFTPVIEQLKAENAQLKSQVGGVAQGVQQSSRDRMLTTLDSQMPDWRDVNKADDFVAWLGNVDPYSGQKRHDMLLKAFEENDAARTMAFFTGYRNEHAALTPAPQPQKKTVPKVDLETLVAPGAARDSGTARAQEGSAKLWTQQEISTFYDQVTAGKYRGKEKDKARIEADIIAAAREGRIR